jgi:tetratricopeptide (TPR) repeat protein
MTRRKKKKKRHSAGNGPARPRISLCMIVRDEEGFLGDCLRSVRDVVDEIVVVDTGSTDSTPRIASDFGSRVFRFEWTDDFSKARNYSVEQATGDWILILDADETIARSDAGKIRALARGDADGYLFTYRGYTLDSNDMRWVANDDSYPEGAGWDGWIEGRVVRMFRRDERIRFQGAVHESADLSIRSFGGTILDTDIIIHHFHEKKGKERLLEKQLQYLRLCEKNLEKFPATAKTHHDMGLIYRYVLKDLPKAIHHQQLAVDLDPGYEEARMALAYSYHQSGDEKATARELTKLLQRNPNYAPALLLCGIILEKRGRIERAIESYERAAALNPNLVDARIKLGTLWLKKGEFARARGEWERACLMNPSNVWALLNMGALELRDGNHVSAQRLLEKALEHSPGNARIWNNLGVLHARRGETQQAIEAFEKAVELDPSSRDTRKNLEALRAKAESAV